MSNDQIPTNEIVEIVEQQDLGNGKLKIIGKTITGLIVAFTLNIADTAKLSAQGPCSMSNFPPQVEQPVSGFNGWQFTNNENNTVIVKELTLGRPGGTAPGLDLNADHTSGVSAAQAISSGGNGRGVVAPTTPLGVYQFERDELGTGGCLDTVTVEVVANGTLPVEKINESVKQIAPHTAKLTWTTGSEINNEGFPIEKSKNGLDWEDFTFVESNIVGGNSTTVQNYEVIDTECEGVTYYRVNQKDYDGKYQVGTTLSVECDINEVISIGPNPTSNVVHINVQTDHNDVGYEVSVVGIDGTIYTKGSINANESTDVDLSNNPAGIYNIFLTPTGAGKPKAFRIVKVD